MAAGYHHDYSDFGDKILQHDPGLTAHLDALALAAGQIAHATAPEETGEFKNSFVVGTVIEDHEGLRAVGFLGSTDPNAVYKEFSVGAGKDRTMNKAMRRAVG